MKASDLTYASLMEAMGLEVLEYEQFGNWSGPWAAILKDGSIVTSYYGSCSGCDPLESCASRHNYNDEIPEETLRKLWEDVGAEPTKDYAQFFAHEEWDSDSRECAEWLKKRLKEHGMMEDEK